MTTKEVVILLARISADLTLMMGRPHDEHRLERLITDIRANIDRSTARGSRNSIWILGPSESGPLIKYTAVLPGHNGELAFIRWN